MRLSEWVKLNSTILYPEFKTHANYLNYMSDQSQKIKLSSNLKINKLMQKIKKLEQKKYLAKLTLRNIREEFKTVLIYPEYAIVCVSWIPVKAYYLIFNMVSILEYLIMDDLYYLSASHKNVNDLLKNLIAKGSLVFNKQEFNKIYNVAVIDGLKDIPPGENVKTLSFDPEKRHKQIIKKLLDYQKEDFKTKQKIKVLSGNILKKFKQSNITYLLDFFYLYRIKANYRDMEFVDKGVSLEEFKDFYEKYYLLTLNFYNCFKDCINQLSVLRLGEKLIQ